ncbi:FG-GAP-like repeat-containing protein [Mucilaginibacter sp. SMC90]|uniref:FG-GAP-like repeat-containing protein n=1 Tax=Mucilaginibacter sp. SMC90 TaxID=2929803 RepID=UPI001FB44A1D|nr:FG-GAP-like repeat-containing protein [Mucilaginibacter sp. SMC90]UOE50107.1 FG-GAP-like repeat-containing protein [Mucilaginibacter sp. SMC90]
MILQRIGAILSVFLFIAVNAAAQAPVVNAFTPSSGPVGTLVNIDGSRFNASASGNTVYFGAVKANIISASNTRITVSVPKGATCQPITVTSNGLTCYASQPFITTFNSIPFTTASLNGKIDIQSGNYPYGVAIKDLDGDGKPDIVVVNSGNDNVSFFKNNSEPGAPSFALATQKAVNNYSNGLTVDDLDGDGKPDVVVANFSNNTISIFKNTSANNQINFDNAITFNTGQSPYAIAIADFNGDGKPDLAVTNEYSYPSYISVYTNSTTQNGQISFLAERDFPSLTNSRGISATDVDLDGKADIIVASQDGFVSVFKNTSAGSTINFDAKIDYNVPSSGGGAESIVVLDFDGDLKPDIAVADNNLPGSVSVWKNNSSVGSVSFVSRQDFSTGQNPFSICAGDINGDGKPDLAVTNQVDNTISVLINSSSSGNIMFNSKLNFPTGDYPRSANMGDIDGNGRPDLIVGNNAGSTVSILLANIQKLPSIITFPPPDAMIIDNNNILHPGATSTNTDPATPITYTSSNPAVAYVDVNGLIHVIAPGVTVITASQSGNDNYDPATPVQETYTIKENLILYLPPFTTKTTCTADFNANVSKSNATIPVTYTSSNPAVATINAQGLIHIIGPGTTIITANQTGDEQHNSATPVSQQLTVVSPVNPTVTITVDNAPACEGSSINFTATPANTSGGVINYQWKINGINTGTNSPTLTITSAAATDVFSCTITENGACSLPVNSNNISNIHFFPYQTPSVTITSSATGPVCSGTSVNFIAIPTIDGGNPTYQWKINGITAGGNQATFSSNTLNNNDKISCDISYNNSLCLVNASATSNIISADIISNSGPVLTISISASESNIYEGSIVDFMAVPSNAGVVSSYQWQINGINAVNGNNATFSTNQLKNNDEVTCIATTTNACSVPVISNPIKITVQLLNVNIPNTFTPNGDGVNDFWSIPALSSYPGCSVKIFTRYGQMVFDTKGYGNPWDGTYKGKLLPASTYYYVVKLDNKKMPFSGYVTIIR